MVDDYWTTTTTDEHCKRCAFYDEPGYCGMLHDERVPAGDCEAILQTKGIHQPEGEQ